MSSLTVTVKLQFAVLPEASVAVQVTAFVPLANVLPFVGLQLTVTEQLSVAVGVKLTIWLHCPAAVFVTMLAGQVIVGTSVSRIVTVKLQFVELPAASVTVQLTVFVPVGKVAPLVGVQVSVRFRQLSEEVTV